MGASSSSISIKQSIQGKGVLPIIPQPLVDDPDNDSDWNSDVDPGESPLSMREFQCDEDEMEAHASTRPNGDLEKFRPITMWYFKIFDFERELTRAGNLAKETRNLDHLIRVPQPIPPRYPTEERDQHIRVMFGEQARIQRRYNKWRRRKIRFLRKHPNGVEPRPLIDPYRPTTPSPPGSPRLPLPPPPRPYTP
jgi:hypothetical protein